MTDLHEDPVTEAEFTGMAAETGRIVRSGTIWTAAGVIAPSIILGPMLASGWRPLDLSVAAAVPFWVGALAAAIGLALLIWAGCPVLGFTLPEAYRQKVFCARVGIVLNPAGMALAALALMLSPA